MKFFGSVVLSKDEILTLGAASIMEKAEFQINKAIKDFEVSLAGVMRGADAAIYKKLYGDLVDCVPHYKGA